jgi:hypothetical protein
MKKILCTLFVVFFAGIMILTSCSSSKNTGVSPPSAVPQTAGKASLSERGPANGFTGITREMASAEDSDVAANQVSGELSTSVDSTQRKIVKYVDLSLETKEFDQAFAQLLVLVESSGGYIEGQTVDGRSLSFRGDYYARSAMINARIPAEKLSEVTAAVGGLCNIASQNEHMSDITDSYYDSQAHLDTLTLQEERLLEILSKAEKLEDVITLENALREVRYQIEALTGALKRMDSQVTYSYLNMHLQEVIEYSETVATPKSFTEQLAISARRAGNHVVSSVQGLLLVVVEIGPVSIVWALFILLIVLVVRRISRSLKKRRLDAKENKKHAEDPQQTQQEPEENKR